MVAKTFKDYKIVSEVYEDGKNKYVKVQHPRTGNIRQVRWYTEVEYLKKYPEDKDIVKNPFNQKKMLGFDKGYITIFEGAIMKNQDWFSKSIARYHNTWGWYIVSTDEIPELPEGITALQLDWELISENDVMFPQAKIKEILNTKIFAKGAEKPKSISQFVGEVGQRLDLTLTVTNAEHKDDYYGTKTIHTMEDGNGNIFIWVTGAKDWGVGTTHKIRGTVKEHRLYQDIEMHTILTRCTEVR